MRTLVLTVAVGCAALAAGGCGGTDTDRRPVSENGGGAATMGGRGGAAGVSGSGSGGAAADAGAAYVVPVPAQRNCVDECELVMVGELDGTHVSLGVDTFSATSTAPWALLGTRGYLFLPLDETRVPPNGVHAVIHSGLLRMPAESSLADTWYCMDEAVITVPTPGSAVLQITRLSRLGRADAATPGSATLRTVTVSGASPGAVEGSLGAYDALSITSFLGSPHQDGWQLSQDATWVGEIHAFGETRLDPPVIMEFAIIEYAPSFYAGLAPVRLIWAGPMSTMLRTDSEERLDLLSLSEARSCPATAVDGEMSLHLGEWY